MADDTTNFVSLKTVLTFQTLMLATLGKWVTTHDRVFYSWKELLLDFVAWIDLTSNADNLPLLSVALEVTEQNLLL